MTAPGLEWEDLRLLEAVHRLRDLRGAARETGQSVSTLYRRITALEAGLGQRCLVRHADEVTLTPLGLSLAQLGRRVQGELTALFSAQRAQEQSLDGEVSLTTVEALVPVVQPAVLALTRAHPGLSVTLYPADRGPSVRRREVDVALAIVQRPPSGCWGRRVRTLDAGVFGTQAAVEQGERWLLRGGSEAASLESAWEREHVQGAVTARGPFQALLGLCVAGAGLLVMPSLIAQRHALVEAPQFRARLRHLTRPLWLLTHPDLRKSPRVQALFDALLAAVAPGR